MSEPTPPRTAIVTGASRGIGEAIARRLGAEGWAVACVARTLGEGDSHLDGSLARTVAAIEADGGRAAAIVADLATDDLDAVGIVEAAEDALGPIDVVVNNAAACFYIPFVEISAKRIDVAYRVNVRSPWLLAQAALTGMVERGRGSVLNISSATSEYPEGPPFTMTGIGGASAYGGSKAWLERASIGAAMELAGTGVSVNTLAPEYAVLTPGADSLMGIGDRDDIVIEPLETMAEAALALVGGDADTLTGRVAYSLSLLRELDRPVRDLAGRDLVEGWQPADFPTHLLRRP